MATSDLRPTVVNSVVSLRGQGNEGVEQMLGNTSLDEVTPSEGFLESASASPIPPAMRMAGGASVV